MKLKTLTLLRIAICAGIVSFMAIATSCTKNDEESGPAKADSIYLPVVMYDNRSTADSFVYNSNNTVSKMYYGYKRNEYHERMDFSYNSAGQCNRIGYFRVTGTTTGRYDSLVYGANGSVTVFRQFPVPSSFDNILRLKLDSEGSLIALSRDTTMNASNSLKAAKWTMTINGGNLTQCDIRRLTDGVNGQLSDRLEIFKYSYDQRPNSLRDFFRKNPVMQVLLGYDSDPLLYTASANNINGFAISDGNTVVQTSPGVNTYDAATGLLIKQTFTNNGNDWHTGNFTYKKVAAQ